MIKALSIATLLALACVLAAWIFRYAGRKDIPADPQASMEASGAPAPPPQAAAPAPASPASSKEGAAAGAYAGSAACKDCHAKAYEEWRGSHHALAERLPDPEADRPAFDPPRSVSHGSQSSEVRLREGRFEVIAAGAAGAGGEKLAYPVRRLFGVSPLYQVLVPFPGGRLQATEIAYDPAAREWFDVYGAEDRRPGEWGHWTGRGMNWNSMCAACHNTGVDKRYREADDSYDTAVAEMGVGCEACHGPMKAHADRQRGLQSQPQSAPAAGAAGAAAGRFSRDEILDACGSCHSRRSELTGRFAPGEKFLDHFAPSIPDETGLYHADGQVHDEDFEYTSFLGSRMHAEGVRCLDCHSPHTGKTLLAGNDLCLRCHKEKIDPAAHSRHRLDQAGGQCVNCHMPQTVYMQRHARRDHGFTIPDPQLTLELSIPNACNRCHKDRTNEWALQAVQERGAGGGDRPARRRARLIAAARKGDAASVDGLVRLSAEESYPLWRAAAVSALKPFIFQDAVKQAVLRRSWDHHPLVRGMAARCLEQVAAPEEEGIVERLRGLLRDDSRFVRIEAAFALRTQVDPLSPAGTDLWNFMQFNADQPAGALMLGKYHLDRGFEKAALPYFQKAVAWDPGSAPSHQALAIGLGRLERHPEAARQMEIACGLEPNDAGLRFQYALALNDAGRASEAIRRLEETVRLDPRFVRAWYNLALARSRAGVFPEALQAIDKALSITPGSADGHFARAAILKQMDRIPEARADAQEALRIQPGYPPAERFLKTLDQADDGSQ